MLLFSFRLYIYRPYKVQQCGTEYLHSKLGIPDTPCLTFILNKNLKRCDRTWKLIYEFPVLLNGKPQTPLTSWVLAVKEILFKLQISREIICESFTKSIYKHSQDNIYRPQRSWAKVMFLQASVILSTGEGEGVCLSACWDARPPREAGIPHPPGADTPLDQVHYPPRPGTPPPRTRHTPPRPGTPPREADASIRSMSGRYASYWNAFLLELYLFFNELYWKLSILTSFPSWTKNYGLPTPSVSVSGQYKVNGSVNPSVKRHLWILLLAARCGLAFRTRYTEKIFLNCK